MDLLLVGSQRNSVWVVNGKGGDGESWVMSGGISRERAAEKEWAQGEIGV